MLAFEPDTSSPDWLSWHQPYNDPESSLSRRLRRVQFRLDQALTDQPPGPIRVLSMCAGQGRDVIGALTTHPRRAEVRALLVEGDPRNVDAATRAAREAGLDGVRVVTGDAAMTSAYTDCVPVDIALVCGVFGNIAGPDIRRTVEHLPALLRPGGTAIWTRTRKAPDATEAIRTWFVQAGLDEVGFDTEDGFLYAVGTNVLTGPTQPFRPGVRLFRFEGDGAEALL